MDISACLIPVQTHAQLQYPDERLTDAEDGPHIVIQSGSIILRVHVHTSGHWNTVNHNTTSVHALYDDRSILLNPDIISGYPVSPPV